MIKKKNILGIILLLTISLIVTGCGKEIEVKNGSKVAVSISGEKFTATEYYTKIKEDNISTLIDMIDTSILEKDYKSDDKEKEYVDNQINQIKNYYGSDENTYKNVLKSYFGVEDEEKLKTKLQLEYKRNKAVEDYVEKHLEEKEIKKYYDENIYGEIKASHILITVDAKDDSTDEEKEKAEKKALEKAKKIIDKLNNGEDFEKLAKKNSKDEATAINGGDLGFFDINDMTESFANAVKDLKVKEYTKEPIKTEYGYHIILKTDEKEKPKLKEVKKDIKEKLRKEKLENNNVLYYETLKNIREDKKISWNDSTLKKAYENHMKTLIDNASSSN